MKVLHLSCSLCFFSCILYAFGVPYLLFLVCPFFPSLSISVHYNIRSTSLQVVEEARDIIAKDSKYETAVVGEDVLLTPRPTEGQTAQPQPEGASLQEAGDALTPSLSLSPVFLFPPSPASLSAPPLPLPCPSLTPP